LYIDYLKEQLVEDADPDQFNKKKKYYSGYLSNLRKGIQYYSKIEVLTANESFTKALDKADTDLDALNYQYQIVEQTVISN
jgi:hypothetical protein